MSVYHLRFAILSLVSIAFSSSQILMHADLVQGQKIQELPLVKEAEWHAGSIPLKIFPDANQACEHTAAAHKRALVSVVLKRTKDAYSNSVVFAADCIFPDGKRGISRYCKPNYYYRYIGDANGVCVLASALKTRKNSGYTDKPLSGFTFALPLTYELALGLLAGLGIYTHTIKHPPQFPSNPQQESSQDTTDAQAPGKPTENDGYIPPKNWNGKKVKNPNGSGAGWLDSKGNVWIPTGVKGHGGSHWDVQFPGGGYINVYPGGKVR
jgi:hypothetical protein